MKWQADSKVLIQGISTPLGAHYGARMKAFGTNIVAGISLDGETPDIKDLPIFNLVEQAIAQVGEIDISLIFTPPYSVLDAALEAMTAGIQQLIIISSEVPPLDMLTILRQAEATNTFILGPGSQGLIVPNTIWLGICEPQFYTPGAVGIISRGDRLLDEVARELTLNKFGQSLAVSLGTNWVIGSNFEQWLQVMEEDDATQVIVLLGQANSSAEVAAAEYIASAIEKPVIAYITGLYAPIERSFRDAKTIVTTQLVSSSPQISTDQNVLTALKKARVKLAQRPSEIPKLVKTHGKPNK
ncbi:CoA-binding domain protein [Rippkaea orientalis PCC 8801]|uniref:CoA-binding domain protein n=1 Tax=Rippkaea orientalis (strain PCC 8801 / RF-1) TaxID=41431 RepID=B7K2C1_RIPO1|nr:CoA-binding protein [Rippkaea orientalis]ACK65257.1 CoA-binding domain protein [Rippkaea orientalis PCC 8801]